MKRLQRKVCEVVVSGRRLLGQRENWKKGCNCTPTVKLGRAVTHTAMQLSKWVMGRNRTWKMSYSSCWREPQKLQFIRNKICGPLIAVNGVCVCELAVSRLVHVSWSSGSVPMRACVSHVSEMNYEDTSQEKEILDSFFGGNFFIFYWTVTDEEPNRKWGEGRVWHATESQPELNWQRLQARSYVACTVTIRQGLLYIDSFVVALHNIQIDRHILISFFFFLLFKMVQSYFIEELHVHWFSPPCPTLPLTHTHWQETVCE